MPSTREGSPTLPGSRGMSLTSDNGVDFEPGYALPRGMLSSNNSVAVTSASGSIDGDAFSTPARVMRHLNSHAFDFTPTTHHQQSSPIRAGLDPIKKLNDDLEAGYEVQKNLRLQKFLVQYPGGAPDFEIERFKQKEAVERTKFVVYKEQQLFKAGAGRAINGYNHNQHNHNQDPYVTAAPPNPHFVGSDFERLCNTTDGPHNNYNNPFRVDHSFPPPPSSSRNRSVNETHGSASSYCSNNMSSTSGIPESASSAANDSNGFLPATGDAATQVTGDSSIGFTAQQIYHTFENAFDRIAKIEGEVTQLRNEVDELKTLLVALTGGSDLNSIVNRITVLEHKLAAIPSRGSPESDAGLRNIAAEVHELNQALVEIQNNCISRRAFQVENELTKMTFNNKCGLIEKYLGIDITTTGPKPHDLLENLHSRLWHLESFLNTSDPNCREGIAYQPINSMLQVKLDKSNTMVNYSATPGYTNGGFSAGSSVYGGDAGVSAMNGMTSALGGMNFSGVGSQMNANAAPFSAAPGTHPRRMSNNLHGHLANMRFDPGDIRHPNNIKAMQEGGAVQPMQADATRRMSTTGLLPVGLVGPDFPIKSPPVKHNSPRRSTGRSSRASFGITSPKRRSFHGGHSRANSTSTEVKDVTEGAAPPPLPTPPIKQTNDRSYHKWLNQKPGEFLGKKLSGLGQIGQKD